MLRDSVNLLFDTISRSVLFDTLFQCFRHTTELWLIDLLNYYLCVSSLFMAIFVSRDAYIIEWVIITAANKDIISMGNVNCTLGLN